MAASGTVSGSMRASLYYTPNSLVKSFLEFIFSETLDFAKTIVVLSASVMIRFPSELKPEPQRERRERYREPGKRALLTAALGAFLVAIIIFMYAVLAGVFQD